MFGGLLPYCLCHGRVHRTLVTVTTYTKSGCDNGVVTTFGQGNGALLLLVHRRCTGYMPKCAASWTCMWRDLTFPFFFRRSFEKLCGVHVLSSIVFVKSRWIFIKCFRFLYFCMREIIWFFDVLTTSHCQQHHLG